MLALLAAAHCGSRTGLGGLDIGDASPIPTCVAVGGACTRDSDCCSVQGDAGSCAPPPCMPGDPPVVLLQVPFDAQALHAVAIGPRDIYFATVDGALSRVPKTGGAPARIATLPSAVIPSALAIGG